VGEGAMGVDGDEYDEEEGEGEDEEDVELRREGFVSVEMGCFLKGSSSAGLGFIWLWLRWRDGVESEDWWRIKLDDENCFFAELNFDGKVDEDGFIWHAGEEQVEEHAIDDDDEDKDSDNSSLNSSGLQVRGTFLIA
jgi:hypothetical protein